MTAPSKFRAIVLGTVRHSDRVDIVHLYTDVSGRIDAIVPASGATKAGRMRRAALMPLSVIQGELRARAGSELQKLFRFSLERPNTGIAGNPIKSAMALFMAEFMQKILREATPDPVLFRFLDLSVETLDKTSAPANFHLALLTHTTLFAGMMPDVSDYTPAAVFDLREGRYCDYMPPHPDVLSGEEARIPVLLMKLNYSNFTRLRLSRETRRRILQGILRYYTLHFPGIETMRSLPVLTQLFS